MTLSGLATQPPRRGTAAGARPSTAATADLSSARIGASSFAGKWEHAPTRDTRECSTHDVAAHASAAARRDVASNATRAQLVGSLISCGFASHGSVIREPSCESRLYRHLTSDARERTRTRPEILSNHPLFFFHLSSFFYLSGSAFLPPRSLSKLPTRRRKLRTFCINARVSVRVSARERERLTGQSGAEEAPRFRRGGNSRRGPSTSRRIRRDSTRLARASRKSSS